MIRLVLILTLTVLLVACGGDGSSSSDDRDAEAIVSALQESGLPIDEFKTFTAEDDPNELLGRPNQYTSKTNFHDTRVEKSETFEPDGGGTIEVFDDDEDAKLRHDTLEGIVAIPMFGQYQFLHGNVLMRLSFSLTPEQAAEYEAALEDLD